MMMIMMMKMMMMMMMMMKLHTCAIMLQMQRTGDVM